MTKQAWEEKPTNKIARIISTSFVIISLLCFLLYTWNDYTESANTLVKNITKQTILSQNDYNYNSISATDTIKTSVRVTTTIQPSVITDLNNEAQQNYLKVKEQISSMRKEIEAETSKMRRPMGNNKHNNPNHHILSYSSDSWSNYDDSFDPMKSLHQILNTSPVVLFIDSTSLDIEWTNSNLLKNILLNNYEISPELVVVDLNKHTNGHILQEYIETYKLNGDENPQLPYLFINSRSVLNKDCKQHLLEYHESNKLLNRFKKFADGKVIFDKLELPSNS